MCCNESFTDQVGSSTGSCQPMLSIHILQQELKGNNKKFEEIVIFVKFERGGFDLFKVSHYITFGTLQSVSIKQFAQEAFLF